MFFDGFNNGNYDFFELDVQTFLFKSVISFHFHFVSYLASRFLTLTLAYVFCPGVIQVVSIKAIGIAIKLTLEGINQIAYPQTWFFLSVAVICVITQLNYLNRVSLMSSIVFIEC